MFGFPAIEHDQDFMFKSNLLKTVIFQLKFTHNEKIIEQEDEIKAQLKPKYTNIKTLIQSEIKIKIEEKTPLVQQSTLTTKGFELRTSDNGIVIVFASDNMTATVTGNVYSNFNQVFGGIIDDFLPFFEKAGVKIFTRCAIRKVNIVGFKSEGKSSPADALPLVFNKILVDNFSFLPCSPDLVSGVTRLNAIKEVFQLNISFGLITPKPIGSQQAQNLVLDIDLFKGKNDTTLEDVREVMTKINNEIFNIFCWAIEPDFLENLKQ